MFECCLRSACPPACRGKGHLMDLVRACDGLSGLSPLPVEAKTISWTWCVLEIGFSPCLSRKRLSHGPIADDRIRLSARFQPLRRENGRPRKRLLHLYGGAFEAFRLTGTRDTAAALPLQAPRDNAVQAETSTGTWKRQFLI